MKFNFNEQGTLVGALVVGHDITERKRAAEELRKAGEALKENEGKLKELIATKDKFFNIVAHDLKNPFTSLIGSSEILYANINNLTPEQTRSLALLLNDSAKRGYSILLNLLDWSRSQTGLLKISTSETNLTDLIDDNISEQQLSASNKNISIINETEEDIYLITDGNILNTVLRNLLSNSIKFTRNSGKVVVAVTKETDNVTILVKDNGIGISPDRIGKLFNIESRNSTPGTENEQGTGLGLKLSKEFIEKLGGRITVESIIDKGSTFRIRFPLI
jgi:signal transduction histidine kinase